MADKNQKFYDIFDQLGAKFTSEQKENLFQEMNQVVEMAVTAKIARLLSDEEKAEFDKLQSDEEVQKFLETNGIDMQAIAIEEAVKFRERFLSDVNYVAGRIEEKKRQQL